MGNVHGGSKPAPGEVTVAWDAAWRPTPRLLPTYTGAIPASQRSPHETVTLVLDGQRNIGHGREFGCKTRLCFDMLRGRRALGKRAIDRVSTRSPCRSGSYRFGECSAGTRSPLSPLLRSHPTYSYRAAPDNSPHCQSQGLAVAFLDSEQELGKGNTGVREALDNRAWSSSYCSGKLHQVRLRGAPHAAHLLDRVGTSGAMLGAPTATEHAFCGNGDAPL
jgi:hypothetical protein